MANNAQSRKWALVINNPGDCGLTHEAIAEILLLFSPDYFCMADEISQSGTYHTHVFFFCQSPVRFSTIKGRFPTAHIEKALGSAFQNRAYIRKDGEKWANSEKAETSVDGTFIEYGKVPTAQAEENPAMCKLFEDIYKGKTNAQILHDDPGFAFRLKEIDAIRQTLLAEQYASEFRDVVVIYVFGKSGAGKTWDIFTKHDPRDICRITNYRKNGIYFDSYSTQDVLVFEEFNSQIPIEEMLNILDVYPHSLPARYQDKIACFTKVYLTSNQPLEEQYKSVQQDRPETWNAFLRRIHKKMEYTHDGQIIVTVLNQREVFYNGQKHKRQSEPTNPPALLPATLD